MDKVRVAVIGTGDFAKVCHIPGIRSHEQAEVVAICGRNEERSASIAAECGIERSYGNLESLFRDADFAAVSIATPDVSHHNIALMAIEHGKHVFCEKPLAMDSAQAWEVTTAAEQAGVVNMVAFTFRYMLALREMRRLIYQGLIGRPFHIAAQVYWGEFLRPQSLTWRDSSGQSSCGIWADAGAHLFDAIAYIFSPVERVFTQLQTIRRDTGFAQPETPDIASCLANLEWSYAGLTAPISASLHASRVSRPRSIVHEVQVLGTAGSLGIPLTRGENEYLSFLPAGSDTWQELTLPSEASSPEPQALGRMMRAFVDAVLRGCPDGEHDATFQDGLNAQLAIDYGKKSAQSMASEVVDYTRARFPE